MKTVEDLISLLKSQGQVEDSEGVDLGSGSFSRVKTNYDPAEQLANLRAINQRAEDQAARDSLARMRNALMGAYYSGDERGIQKALAGLSGAQGRVGQIEGRDLAQGGQRLAEKRLALDESLGKGDLNLREILGRGSLGVQSKATENQAVANFLNYLQGTAGIQANRDIAGMQNETARRGQDYSLLGIKEETGARKDIAGMQNETARRGQDINKDQFLKELELKRDSLSAEQKQAARQVLLRLDLTPEERKKVNSLLMGESGVPGRYGQMIQDLLGLPASILGY